MLMIINDLLLNLLIPVVQTTTDTNNSITTTNISFTGL
jgi:hypothetical protein